MKPFCFFLLLTISISALASPERDSFRASSTEPHQFVLLNHGISAFEARLELIEKANKKIDVEYYEFNSDETGIIFSQALIKKASQGVKVRMLLDYYSTQTTFSPFFAHEMGKYGIEVKYYNPTPLLNLSKSLYRNHRKLLLIDGEEAITGGRNLGNEYFDLHEKLNYLDHDLQIKGPIVSDMEATFESFWNSALSKKVDREKMPKISDAKYRTGYKGSIDSAAYHRDLRKYNSAIKNAQEKLANIDIEVINLIRNKGRELLQTELRETCHNVELYSEHPIIGKESRHHRVIKYDIAQRFLNAKESILFDTPYFIVNDELEKSLKLALENKVKITLLTNSIHSSDQIYMYIPFHLKIKSWISHGLEAHVYNGKSPENYDLLTDELKKARFGIHAKSWVFDNKDTVVGSYNTDPRSANLNGEMVIACNNNQTLAAKLSENINEKLKNSIYLDSEEAAKKAKAHGSNFWKRLKYLLLRIPANTFKHLL